MMNLMSTTSAWGVRG